MESTIIETSKVDRYFAELIAHQFEIKDDRLIQLIERMMANIRKGNICSDLSDDEMALIPPHLIRASPQNDQRLFVRFQSLVYFQRHWLLESRLIDPVLKRLALHQPVKVKPVDGLNAGQQRAMQKALEHHFFILSGGPGTGKTHTISHIIHALNQKKDIKVALCAPTGKAVSQLKAVSDKFSAECMTLHALLGIKSAKDLLSPPRVLMHDLLIVDECSMVDLGMWSALLSTCAPHTKLILCGDPNQLPSVEGGNVFEELCAFCEKTGYGGYAKLDQCMRTNQKQLQGVANAILSGEMVDTVQVMPTVDDLICDLPVCFKEKHRESTSYESIFQKAGEFQILSALRKGSNGVDALNREIFKQITADLKADDYLAVPMIMTRNAFDLGLTNGDYGIWMHCIDGKGLMPKSGDKVIFLMEGTLRTFPIAMLPSFELAYVLSVHKSQGSEYDKVLMLLPSGSENFGRQVLYTAVTRARSELTIAGSYDTLRLCIQNNEKRLSGLADRLGEFVCKK